MKLLVLMTVMMNIALMQYNYAGSDSNSIKIINFRFTPERMITNVQLIAYR